MEGMGKINVSVNVNKAEEVVILTKEELEAIVYKASYKAANMACSQLYDGLQKRYFQQFEEDIKAILHEIEEGNR